MSLRIAYNWTHWLHIWYCWSFLVKFSQTNLNCNETPKYSSNICQQIINISIHMNISYYGHSKCHWRTKPLVAKPQSLVLSNFEQLLKTRSPKKTYDILIYIFKSWIVQESLLFFHLKWQSSCHVYLVAKRPKLFSNHCPSIPVQTFPP